MLRPRTESIILVLGIILQAWSMLERNEFKLYITSFLLLQMYIVRYQHSSKHYNIEVKSIFKQHVWNLQAHRSASLPDFSDAFPNFKTEHGGLREDGSPDQRVGTGGM
jgi:hypothetical protein